MVERIYRFADNRQAGGRAGGAVVFRPACRPSLQRRSGRIIWLNPLMGAVDFTPETRGMQAALPFIDVLAPGHSLDALRAVVRHLSL